MQRYVISLLLALAGSSSASAATIIQEADCHVYASDAAPVVGRLYPGEHATWLDAKDGWTHIKPAVEAACWLHDAAVAREGKPALEAAVQKRAGQYAAARGRATYAISQASAPQRRRISPWRNYLRPGVGGGSCPCNGGAVCIGPRGGRYCITSGGNKRYGV